MNTFLGDDAEEAPVTEVMSLSWGLHFTEFTGIDDERGGTLDPPPGRWQGRSAELLGVDQTVDLRDAQMVFGHRSLPNPGQGRGVIDQFDERNPRPSAPGYVITLAPGRSFSVLFAVGGEEAMAAVSMAQDAAVEATVEFINRYGATAKRGPEYLDMPHGVVAASFRNFKDHAGDPHIHDHLLISSLAFVQDFGRECWLSLHVPSLREVCESAATVYESTMAGETARALGISTFHDDRTGRSEVLGMPREMYEFPLRNRARRPWWKRIMGSHR